MQKNICKILLFYRIILAEMVESTTFVMLFKISDRVMERKSRKIKLGMMAGFIALLSSFILSSYELPVAQADAPGLEIPVIQKKAAKGKAVNGKAANVTGSGTIKRRFAYTVSYNHGTRQPNWVAWTLTRAHASGKLKRGDFEDDMDMPSPKGTKADYFNTGFDRGHMCPAGDNKWNQKAMDECFLMTNMCPQTHALNAGVWNSIEQQCRTWAKKYGKVYIVCGPIFLNKQHRKLGKNKVVVPDAFFKVILRTGKNPQAIGFICRNQSAKGLQKKDFVNSVDEVERITGYDFFSKLPDNVEKKIEAKADLSNW
mgnify:FL=1